MQASETQLFKLLGGQQHFMIPLFQRVYSWTVPNWDALWKDVMETYEVEGASRHFLGSVVTKSLPATPEGVSPFLVIDGQQRLTTLTILLTALRDAAKATSPQTSEQIQELYLTNKYASGPTHYKVLPTQADRAAYFAVIGGNHDTSSSKVHEAYRYFRSRLDETDENDAPLDLKRLQQVIVGGFELVSITLGETDNEYRIFESLNATGTPLTQADLLRNYFFMRIPVAEQEHIYTTVWLPLQETLRQDLENFFRYEYMSEGGQFVREADVYQEWKKRLDKLTPAALIDQLGTFAEHGRYYARLVHPEREPVSNIAARLTRLNRWGSQTLYPFLLYVYRCYAAGEVDAQGVVDILTLLESFLVRRFIARVPTNQLNRLFIRLAQQLPPDLDLVSGTWAALSKPGLRWPGDDEFRDWVRWFPLYQEGRYEQRRLVLESLEMSYGHKEVVDLAPLTIEHVMPQTLTAAWSASLGAEAEDVHKRLLHVLGNLTLTGYNAEMSNASFEKKREALAQSNIAMNKEIAQEEEWTAAQIERRGDRLADRAVSIWPGPVGA